MGSFEEEELVRMVHDFIESESAPPIFTTSSDCRSLNHQTKHFALQEILRSGTEGESKVLESVLKHMRSKKDALKNSGLKKWLLMRLKADGYDASLCQTSWVTSLGCPAGDYEYIDVTVTDENGDPMRLIVDIDFRSQFELARPTPAYKELTDTLPFVFVGKEEKLNKIITLLCSAAKQSLTERGLHVPPWRTSTYMQCKWLKRSTVTAATTDFGFGLANRESVKAKGGGGHGFGRWAPPIVKPKSSRDLGGAGGGGSALSSQFSNVGINCC